MLWTFIRRHKRLRFVNRIGRVIDDSVQTLPHDDAIASASIASASIAFAAITFSYGVGRRAGN